MIVTEETTESQDDSLLLSDETDLSQKLNSPQSSILPSDNKNNSIQNSSSKQKPALPKKPDITVSECENNAPKINGSIPKKGELTVSELYSESDTSEIYPVDRKRLANGSLTSSLKRSDSKSKEKKNSNVGKKEILKDNNQNITYMQHDEGASSGINRNTSHDSLASEKQADINMGREKSDVTGEQPTGKGRRNKRKQVL